jgi:hypothetical protein
LYPSRISVLVRVSVILTTVWIHKYSVLKKKKSPHLVAPSPFASAARLWRIHVATVASLYCRRARKP